MKLLIVGLDAAPIRLLQPIPLLRDYSMRKLNAPVPLSGPSWFAIYTGLPASEHGVLDVVGRKLSWAGVVPKTYPDVYDKTMWHILEQAGISCGLCNLPTAVPVLPDVASLHTSGYPAHPDSIVWPKKMLDTLPTRWLEMCDLSHYGTFLGGEELWHNDWPQLAKYWTGNTSDMLFNAVMDDSVEVAKWFTRHARGFDVGFVSFTFIDRLGHMFGLSEMVKNACSAVISEIMRVLRHVYAENILIVSDHGFRDEHDPTAGLMLEHHEADGTIGLLSHNNVMELPEGDMVNTDVFPLVMKLFGLDDAIPKVDDNVYDAEAEKIVLARLEGLGYM